ncbi:MAG: hypothetical protein H7068_11610 [Pedobacter sp.]|nr:hypothetical protein [Chitinophagaceae bacterium]
MKLFHCLLFLFSFSLYNIHLYAQEPLKIAVFAPIYLDSAFNGDSYKLNNNLPKYILPGLEFYNGIMMAVDSLKAEGKELEIQFYDTKGSESIYTIIRKPEFENIGMIIACFNNRNDVKPLADIALHRNIPLISSTFPNDGGVTDNPFFVLINTSLKTHIEEIYKYVQRNYSINNIVYIKHKGGLEDMLFTLFSNINRNTASIPLKYKTIELNDGFDYTDLTPQLDSTRQNIIICGSLNEAFGLHIVKILSAHKTYPTIAVGMPTWDGLKELDKGDCNGVNLVYTTSYNFPKNSAVITSITQAYRTKFNARPSDQFYKGFESMYHFSNLLIAYPNDIINHLSDKAFKVSNDFNIEPIKSKTDNLKIDYLENKKIYFIKKLDGIYK